MSSRLKPRIWTIIWIKGRISLNLWDNHWVCLFFDKDSRMNSRGLKKVPQEIGGLLMRRKSRRFSSTLRIKWLLCWTCSSFMRFQRITKISQLVKFYLSFLFNITNFIDSFHEPENERSPLLSEQEFQKISLKLSDDTDNEYKEALRKHVITQWSFKFYLIQERKRIWWGLEMVLALNDILRLWRHSAMDGVLVSLIPIDDGLFFHRIFLCDWYFKLNFYEIKSIVILLGYKDLPGILVGAAQKQFNSLVGKHAMSMAVKVGLK